MSLDLSFFLSGLMGAASFAAMTNKAITKEDLPALKGKWKGVRTVGGGTTANTDLEIYKIPVLLKVNWLSTM